MRSKHTPASTAVSDLPKPSRTCQNEPPWKAAKTPARGRRGCKCRTAEVCVGLPVLTSAELMRSTWHCWNRSIVVCMRRDTAQCPLHGRLWKTLLAVQHDTRHAPDVCAITRTRRAESSKNVSVAEALTTFEYENVDVGIPAERKSEIVGLVTTSARSGVCKACRARQRGHHARKRTHAHSIVRWPRLEASLDAALSGFPVPVLHATLGAACASRANRKFILTRATVPFAGAHWPSCRNQASRIRTLAQQTCGDKVAGKDRDAKAFDALLLCRAPTRLVHGHAL